MLMGEAQGYYESREEEIGDEVMRQVERQIMLQIIDQKWREHLYEMDYLQEGIHLRAMGQKDPLVEWQREGFDMFGQMMHGIAQDFVKYVMHAQVTVAQQQTVDAPQVSNVSYSAPEDPSSAASTLRGRRDRRRPVDGACPERPAPPEEEGRQRPGREDRVGQDPAQRPLPLRQRQEIQDVPRPAGAR